MSESDFSSSRRFPRARAKMNSGIESLLRGFSMVCEKRIWLPRLSMMLVFRSTPGSPFGPGGISGICIMAALMGLKL